MIEFTLTTESDDSYTILGEIATLEQFLEKCLEVSKKEYMRLYGVKHLEPAHEILVINSLSSAAATLSEFKFTNADRFISCNFEKVSDSSEDLETPVRPEPFSINYGELSAWEWLSELLKTTFESDDKEFGSTVKVHTETLDRMFKRYTKEIS